MVGSIGLGMETNRTPQEPAFPLSDESAGRLSIRLLGGFGVRLSGLEVPDAAFARRKPKSLLKLLALQGANRLHRDQVIEALWTGLQSLGGAAQLYKAVHQARKALSAAGSGIVPQSVLVLANESLWLQAPGGVQTDVELFQRLSRQALEHRERSNLERALAAYTGELLPTDLYEDWSQEPREVLRGQATALALALGEVLLEAGEFNAAQVAFERCLKLDELQEAAYRGLFVVYARFGDYVGLEQQYRCLVEVLAQSLDTVPSAQSSQQYESLLADASPSSTRALIPIPLLEPLKPAFHNLPAPPNHFVGRNAELTEIAERLNDPNCRLLTLVGPAGVGKTRLGLQAVAERLEDFKDGVYFVPLAQLPGPEFLLGAIAQALQVSLYPGSDLKSQLIERLRQQQILLMLDNFEHLLDGAELVAELLETAPQLKFLVSSRERLNLRSEWLLEVGGLEYPTKLEDAQSYGAVRLFLDHLRRTSSGFSPDDNDLAAIVQICRLVDGFPLSLELAAAQGRLLSCSEIAVEIERGLAVLEVSQRDLPPRHRSQHAAFEPSWLSLSPLEQQVFAGLSVFRGGFRREAAEAVTGANLGVLSKLVDKSLLRRMGNGRFDQHELLRQFGAEKLNHTPQHLEIIRDRHARFYCQYLSEQESRLKSKEHRTALQEIAQELDNIRAAWLWAAARGDVDALGRSLGALWIFVASRGSSLWAEQEEALCQEIIEVLERRGLPEFKPMLWRVKTAWAAMSYRLGLYDLPRTTLEENIALFRRAGADGELAFALHHLAAISHLQGDYIQERALLTESITLSRLVGDQWLTAYSLNDLGLVTHLLGEDSEADRRCSESLESFEQSGDPRGKAYALGNLGVITLALGRFQDAERLHRTALRLGQDNSDLWAVVSSLLHLGDVAIAQGNPSEARQLLRQALQLASTERIAPVALSALTGLAALRADQQPERAHEWLSLVLLHPATSREVWAKANGLSAKLELGEKAVNSPGPTPQLPQQQATARLEVVTAAILGEGG